MKTYVLTEEQETILGFAKDIIKTELGKRAEHTDHERAFPEECLKILAEAGMIGCAVPEIYGGADLDYWSQTAVIGEAAKECASTAWALANTAMVAECIFKCGNEELKKESLPVLTSGGFAVAAGSDGEPCGTEVIMAFAEHTDAGYILKGVKKHVPGAGHCEWYLIKAKTENGARWFAVAGSDIKAAYEPELLGMKGCPLGEISLDSCKAEILSDDADKILSISAALNMASVAAGIAKGALSETTAYVKQRVQFGKTIAEFENTRQVMAEMTAKTEALRALVWEAARLKDSGEDGSEAAYMAKAFAGNTVCYVTRKCLQLMGGYGYSREYPLERKMRDAKMCEILGGATEEMKCRIADMEL